MSGKSVLENPWVLAGCVYYSQNREDLILQSFFPDVKKGFYVDVGAFHPDYDSVTKIFYKQGWHGINIEPQAELYRLFQRERKRDINLKIGIARKKGKLTLRSYKNGGLSTFSPDIQQEYEATPTAETENYEEHTVEVLPLHEVFARQKVKHIHFMKIDVEGFEYEVIASNDWKRYRPEVLCIENNHILHDWRPILRDADYERVFDDGLNVYYVDKKTDRKKKLNFVQDVIIDRGGGVRAERFDMMGKLYDYGMQKTKHVEELHAQVEMLDDKVKDYKRRESSVKATVHQLLRLIAAMFTGKKVGDDS